MIMKYKLVSNRL